DARAVEIIDSRLEDLEGVIQRAAELFLLTDDTTAHEIARQKLNDAKAEKVELLKQKDDGKEFVISAEAIKEFEGYIQR
ncbi:recombinase family protein, partial [Vibrio anguillarum]|nr:recombinase family protein [Vibrio anguillarum]